MPLVLLDELGVPQILLGEVRGHLGDEVPRDGEATEEGPVSAPLPAEEHRPRIEGPHSRQQRFSISSLCLRRVLAQMARWGWTAWWVESMRKVSARGSSSGASFTLDTHVLVLIWKGAHIPLVKNN